MVRRNLWVVALTMVVGIIAALTYSMLLTPVYESAATVRAFDASQSGSSAAAKVDPTREIGIQVLYAQSPEVAAEATKRLGPRSAQVSAVTIAAVDGADAVQFSADSTSKQVALDAAQAYADVFVAKRREVEAAPLLAQADKLKADAATTQAQVADLDRQLAAAEPKPTTDATGRLFLPPESEVVRNLSSQRAAAAAHYDDDTRQASALGIEATTRQAAVNIVSPPTLPDTPVVPATALNLAIGAVLGLVLGLGIAFLREFFDNKVRSTEALEKTGAGFVVPVPKGDRRVRRLSREGLITLVDPQAPVVEAYRSLRAYLVLGNGQASRRSFLFAGTESSNDTTAANVAVSLAQVGRRVAFVDADLRTPGHGETASLTPKRGLAGVLARQVSVGGTAQKVELHGTGQLDVILSGGPVLNPSELLMSSELTAALDELNSSYEYVVIKGPPVLTSAEGLPLAKHADAVVLVTELGRTPVADVGASLDRLRMVSASVVGMVVTEMPQGRYQSSAAKRGGQGVLGIGRSPVDADTAVAASVASSSSAEVEGHPRALRLPR